eukprot:4046970-Pleurochrysis_carterae.AAC.1
MTEILRIKLEEQEQGALSEIDAVLAASPLLALDREAPFGGEGRGPDVPLAPLSEVGTQGKSCVRA